MRSSPSSCGRPWSKWVTFTASCLIQACAGLAYSFSVYAPAIKERLGLSQVELATVGSAVNLGGYLAVVSGAIYDATKDHPLLGPRLVIVLGSLCCLCGYLGLWLMVSGRAPGGFAELLMFAVCAGNTGVWYDTAAICTNVRNFPNSRGKVVGVLKSFLGLSASLYTSIYIAGFAPDAVTFLLVLGVAPAIICTFLGLFVNYVPFVEASETPGPAPRITPERRFLLAYCLVAGIAVYQCLSAVLLSRPTLPQAAKSLLATGCIALVCLVTLIPIRSGGWRASFGHEHAAGDVDNGGTGSGGGGGGGSAALRGTGSGGAGGAAALLAVATADARSDSGSPRIARRATTGARREAAAAALGMPRGGSKLALAALSGGSGDEPGGGLFGAGGSSERLPLLAAAAADGAPTAVGSPQRAAHPPGLLAATDGNGGGAGSGGGGGLFPAAPSSGPPSLSTSQMLATAPFWCVFLQFFVGSGASLALLNNLGQLVVALGGPRGGQVVLVSLFSVANAAGRLLAGYGPEHYLHSRGVPRPAFLALVGAGTSLACLGAANASLPGLYPTAVLVGLLFGSHWSLVPAICSDIFGLANFGTNYAALQLAPAFGSYLLATRLTGALYDRTAADHGDGAECIGPDCFREAFLLLAALTAAGAVACCFATAQTRKVYRQICKHMHEVEDAEARLSP